MLLFRDEEAVQYWCDQSGEPYGEIVPFQQVWELSKRWYRNRMTPTYRGRSAAEAEYIFIRTGFSSEFWKFA